MLFNSKPIEFDGKIYQSQHELAKTFNLSIATVSQLKNNPEKLKTYITNKIQGKTNRPVKNPYKNIGLILGDFKVEEYLGQYKSKAFKYKAACTTCGHTIIKDIYNLRKKCACAECHKQSKDKYVGTKIGDFEVIQRIETPKDKFTKYKVICTNCGNEKIQPIYHVKKNCKCKKCKMATKVYNIFKKAKDDSLEHYDIISYSYESGKIYKYLLKCKYCGKEIWVNKNSINTTKTCECRKHENGKFIAKHHGEIINGWLLEDTGKNAYNSRNRLYKYTCTECGAVKYDQYSISSTNTKCKHNKFQTKKEPKDISKLKIIKGKVELDTKILSSYLESNDLEALKIYIAEKLQK